MRDVSVSFGLDRGTSKVLDDVDIDVQRDEILGVVGESGSGKSMLANAMMNAVPGDGQLEGDVTYKPRDGTEIDILNQTGEGIRQLRWEEISLVSQGALSSFNPTMRIRKHFEETLDNHDYDMYEGMERAHQLLSDLYLDPERVLDSYPHELSGGMRQRALIALSLILEPELVVMDEPTAALDLLMQRSILNLLRQLQRRYDLTIVFITHDLALVAELADRLAVMYSFEIAEIGSTEEILGGSAHPYTRLLLRSTPDLDAPVDEMRSVEGSSPDPVNVPPGCSFAPRCPMETDQCMEDPPMYRVGDGHSSACHHWDQVDEHIQLSTATQTAGGGSGSRPATGSREGDGDPLVRMRELSVHFEQTDGGVLSRRTSTVRAVDDVSLDIYENDVVALVGESGCGKTTLGKAAIALQRPTEGSVEYRSHDVWAANDDRSLLGQLNPFGSDDAHDPDSIEFSRIRRALQIIHQDPGSALNPNKRVISTLQKPLQKWHDMDRNEREQRIHSLLELVGMSPAEDYAGRYPHQLSGGEQQRVALVRALLMNPDMILADEAISALDVSLRVETMDLLLELQEMFSTSYLFISHDLSNARYLTKKADGRIAVMYLGEVVEIGPVDAVIDDPQHPYTQVLRWATPDLEEGDSEQIPMRKIDIPDATNPPSGCRFHTRCPYAREVCRSEHPEPIPTDDGKQVACFRADDTHEYWESDSIVEDDPASDRTDGGDPDLPGGFDDD
jgi:peptide/nickel transport system ATP-binding protein